MGNSLGHGRKKVKVMKITGETLKLKTPVQASDVVKDYPGHVVMDSDLVKQFGVRAHPLDPHQPLKPKKLYFLVELPKFTNTNDGDNNINNYGPRSGGSAYSNSMAPRRVRSGIHMSAKDRLECLMLSRRSASDLPISRTAVSGALINTGVGSPGSSSIRVKMRLTKAQMDKLMAESKDEAEVAEKVLGIYMMEKTTNNSGEIKSQWGMLEDRRVSTGGEYLKAHEKRVRFSAIEEGDDVHSEILQSR